MKPYLICPTCGSDDVMKNGMTRRGKQNHKCRECGRQFVENPHWTPKDTDTLAKIELLLLEGISLAGIALLHGRFPELGLKLCEPLVRCNRTLAPQSFRKKLENTQSKWMKSGMKVDVKGNKQWVPLAMDTKTREVNGCHIGDRSSKSALALWDSLPSVYRLQCQDLYRSLGSLCRSFTK